MHRAIFMFLAFATLADPGLRLEFGDGDVRSSRLVALYVEAGESPSELRAPGPFEATWSGTLSVGIADQYRFKTEGNGSAEIAIGGETLGADPLRLRKGANDIRVRYTAPADGHAEFRLLWAGSDFGWEPIPPSALSHQPDDALRSSQAQRQGKRIWQTHNCAQCHNDGFKPQTSPAVFNAGSRLRPGWIADWLRNPQAMHADATMPKLLDNAQDSRDVASWLVSLAPGDGGQVTGKATAGGPIYAKLGCAGCHSLDGSDDRVSLANVRAKYLPQGLVNFLKNPSPYSHRMPNFRLSDDEADNLAAFLLERGDAPAEFSGGDVARGKELAQKTGCFQCHALPLMPGQLPSFAELAKSDWTTGCMADAKPMPDPQLSAEERSALREFRKSALPSLAWQNDAETAENLLKEMRCDACHQRDGVDDRWSKAMPELAQWLEHAKPAHGESKPEIDQARPQLTWAGEKLRPDWLAQVIRGAEKPDRPWLTSRMPGFVHAEQMARGLAKGHGVSPELETEIAVVQPVEVKEGEEKPPVTAEQARWRVGDAMVSKRQGFGCIDCHGVGTTGPKAVYDAQGTNLGLISRRLRKDFYQRWMQDPMRIDPRTRMPRYTDSYGLVQSPHYKGNSERNFDAIWYYLRDGAEIKEPVAESSGASIPIDGGEGGHWGKDQEDDWLDGRWNVMDVGPFLACTARHPLGLVKKGMVFRLGDSEAAMLFDSKNLGFVSGWEPPKNEQSRTLYFAKFRYGLTRHPRSAGRNIFLAPGAGWPDRWQGGGNMGLGYPGFASPDLAFPNLGWASFGWSSQQEHLAWPDFGWPGWGVPAQDAQYRGVYMNGRRTVLSYTVAGANVLESPWLEKRPGTKALTRSFEVSGDKDLKVQIAYRQRSKAKIEGNIATLTSSEGVTAVALIGNGATLAFENARVVAKIPPGDARRFKTLIWSGKAGDFANFASLVAESAAPENLQELSKPGPKLWPPLTTTATLGQPRGPFRIDTINLPFKNPFKALMFLCGVDFFSNGDVAVSSVHGDVWIVKGVDDDLGEVTWQRYATGLYQPMGLRIVDDKLYVLGRDQISILHDRDGNGEADWYENFNNMSDTSDDPHYYSACLQTDSEGNFYHIDMTGIHKVSKDGKTYSDIATGWRVPIAMSVGPDDTITVGPQEGGWTPTTIIDEVRPGGYYGYPGPKKSKKRPLGWDPHLVYVPRLIDNSAGGQLWVDNPKWGELDGKLLHLSYGQSSAHLVLRDRVDGVPQGAIVPLGLRFLSGAMRGRFNPKDGNLYVVGLHGWTTNAMHDGCLQRVHRVEGEPLRLPIGIRKHANGVRLTFTEALDAASAGDVGSYGVEQWNYRHTKNYGSEEYSVKDPDKVGHDLVPVEGARVLADGKSVFLEIAGLAPVHSMWIRYNLQTKDGAPLRGNLYSTINTLAPPLTESP
jgi:mono/diheme cytochrome c family protein